MKVVFIQDAPNVGRKNEVKDVADGYARNFLFPQNLAKPATEQALKAISAEKAREEREKSEEYQKYKALVDKLKSLTLTFKVRIVPRPTKVGRDPGPEGLGREKGRAFGSVTAVKIRDALKKQGIEVEKDWILLEESIKTSGEKMVKIRLPQEFVGEVKVIVEAE